MPEPMGQTGGWESYPLDPAIYPGKKVVFQYAASMELKFQKVEMSTAWTTYRS